MKFVSRLKKKLASLLRPEEPAAPEPTPPAPAPATPVPAFVVALPAGEPIIAPGGLDEMKRYLVTVMLGVTADMRRNGVETTRETAGEIYDALTNHPPSGVSLTPGLRASVMKVLRSEVMNELFGFEPLAVDPRYRVDGPTARAYVESVRAWLRPMTEMGAGRPDLYHAFLASSHRVADALSPAHAAESVHFSLHAFELLMDEVYGPERDAFVVTVTNPA